MIHRHRQASRRGCEGVIGFNEIDKQNDNIKYEIFNRRLYTSYHGWQ